MLDYTLNSITNLLEKGLFLVNHFHLPQLSTLKYQISAIFRPKDQHNF